LLIDLGADIENDCLEHLTLLHAGVASIQMGLLSLSLGSYLHSYILELVQEIDST
jgi:hypothetical protein